MTDSFVEEADIPARLVVGEAERLGVAWRIRSPNCAIWARVAPFWFGVLLWSCITDENAVMVVLSPAVYWYFAEKASRRWSLNVW